ncbi:MAG: hypothetical protein A3G76_13550 [Acidobacteria bacterium RIFCSPLOWO2_12_FULL_65_11]|nr:MAG: hypothetical protein A3H95_00065 [Acidobacteria bacterium RIFCSPLOWO2_02_FULL_64_15]OFW28090.1 MAG: hypothetical protein A3G76_13550 [Acidobacteria bacterium RIFCSPLOWO2_12_FULL_65_11]
MGTAAKGLGIARMQHIVLWVSNVERSVRFYCDVLGLEVSRQRPGAAFLKIPGNPDDHDLGLFEQPGALPPDERVARIYHSAWEVADLRDLARAQQRLMEVGALVGSSNHGTSLSLYAKDPDGLEFEVFWTVPGGVSGRRTALDIDAEMSKRGITPSKARSNLRLTSEQFRPGRA